jgi:hypothetical protein
MAQELDGRVRERKRRIKVGMGSVLDKRQREKWRVRGREHGAVAAVFCL